jgi:hypothetical protein
VHMRPMTEAESNLMTQVLTLRRQLGAVRRLHQPRWDNCINACCSGEQCKHRTQVCQHDYDEWPCPTIRAIDKAT